MKKFFTLVSLLMLFLQGNALDYSNPGNNNYVNEWGKLKLVGNQLCSESGQPVQLRGWSTHGKQWQGSCFDDKDDFRGMKELGANIARIAMYVNEGGSIDLNWIKQCVQWTEELGMYCLVDFHVLTPGDVTDGSYSGADNFFADLSQWVVSEGHKNVLYEICNEPNERVEGDIYRPKVWSQIKSYSNRVLPNIAKNDPTGVVIVGTPQWDKALSFPMEDPIDTYGLNVMYTFHHYAYDQQQFLGLLSAAAGFIPVFVTEWGTSGEDGGTNGQISTTDSDKLMDVCRGLNLGEQIISWCNWSWASDYRSSSALKSCGNYSSGNLTASGNYIYEQLKKGDSFKTPSSSAYQSAQKISANEDSYIALEKYDEGGQDNSFFEYDDKSWLFDVNGTCNAGGEARKDECVDLGVTSKTEPFFYNIGYIVAGEWVKYTIDVEKAGDYEFETFTCDHIDNNIYGISVDGKNAIVDEDGNDTYKALKLKTSGSGSESGGYGDWGWTTPYSPYTDKKFRIRFESAGEHKLGIAFMTGCSGLGSIKIIGKDNTGVESVSDFKPVSIYPNPSADGTFFVTTNGDAVVKVLSAQGSLLFNGNVNGGVTTKIESSLQTGIYFVVVEENDNVTTTKLVVK